jgi:hypothetical protein
VGNGTVWLQPNPYRSVHGDAIYSQLAAVFFPTPNFLVRSHQWHCAYRTHGAIYQQPHEGAKVSRQMAKTDGDLWEPPGRMYEDAELVIL